MESKLSLRLRQKLKSLVLDKNLLYQSSEETPSDTLGPGDMMFALIKLFIIDVLNLIETKAALAKNFHIQPSELDRMPYWEYEMFRDSINEQVKEENDRQQKEMDKYHVKEHMDNMRPGKMQKMMNPKFSPQMPNLGAMKTPSFKF